MCEGGVIADGMALRYCWTVMLKQALILKLLGILTSQIVLILVLCDSMVTTV